MKIAARIAGSAQQYYSVKLTLSFDVICRGKPKPEYLVSSRQPDFAGMMRPGHDQSTPFGWSATRLTADFLPRMDTDAHGLKTGGHHI
jgi:hypothetical protein